MLDVISFGSATVDAFVHTDSELISIKTLHSEEDLIAYPSGSKMLISSLDFKIGGGGTNTAYSFKKLGLKTAFVGRIGKDQNGEKILEFLKKNKIQFLGQTGKGQSGFSIILDSIEDDRTILTKKGENDNLSYKVLPKAKWYYFSSMMNKSLNSLIQYAKYAKKNNIKICFNPSSYLITDENKKVKELLGYTNVLIFNKEEAELLVGKGDLKELLRKCKELGPQIVIITNGKKGVYVLSEKYIHKRPYKTKVVETTGAGDAFASGFIAGYSKGNIEKGIRFGLTNSKNVIEKIGAKEGIKVIR